MHAKPYVRPIFPQHPIPRDLVTGTRSLPHLAVDHLRLPQ